MKKETIDKLKNAAIIVLSLIIVFGLAYVVPELKNCNSCKKEEKTITDISMDEFREILNGEDASLIYIASPQCAHCMAQEPIMKRLVNEYDVVVNYLNVLAISDQEADEVYSLYGDMQVEKYELSDVRTPTMLVVQQGKVIDMHLGEMALDELVDFLGQYMTIEE